MGQWKLLVLVVVVGASAPAVAGDVFKCAVGGATVFQDTPCANGKKVEVAGSVVGPPPVVGRDIHTLTSREMQARIRTAGDRLSHLADELRRETAAVRARYGTKDGRTALAEMQRVEAEYKPRMDREAATIKALADEEQKRCPRGAALNASQPTC